MCFYFVFLFLFFSSFIFFSLLCTVPRVRIHNKYITFCQARGYLVSRRASPSIGTKLYCLVTEVHVCIQLAPYSCTRQRGGRDSNPRPLDRKSGSLTNRPPSHTRVYGYACLSTSHTHIRTLLRLDCGSVMSRNTGIF